MESGEEGSPKKDSKATSEIVRKSRLNKIVQALKEVSQQRRSNPNSNPQPKPKLNPNPDRAGP